MPISRVTSRASASLLSSTMRPICLIDVAAHRRGHGGPLALRRARGAAGVDERVGVAEHAPRRRRRRGSPGCATRAARPPPRSSPPTIEPIVLVSVMLMRRSVLTVERASVVIVGGGVIGASIAFHLAEAGVEDVLLVERGELGSGSTAEGAGGVRAMFSDELNVRHRAALASRPGRRSASGRAGRSTCTGWATCSCCRAEDDVSGVRARRRAAEPARRAEPDGERRTRPQSCRRWPGWTACWRAPSARWRATRPPDGAVQGYASGRPCERSADRDAREVTGIESTVVTVVAVRAGAGGRDAVRGLRGRAVVARASARWRASSCR